MQNVSGQLRKLMRKANYIMFFIARELEFRNREVLLQLLLGNVEATAGGLQFFVLLFMKEYIAFEGSLKEIHETTSWDKKIVLSGTANRIMSICFH